MNLNKFVLTKNEKRVYVLQFNEEEFEDLRSAFSLAVRVADKEHRDSPKFRSMLHKMNRRLGAIQKDVINRIKQKRAKNV